MRSGLASSTVVLTRRPEDNATLAADLRARGADVIELPCVRAGPLADDRELRRALARLSAADLLVLTSRAGVDAVAAAGPLEGIRCAVAAIGPATADRARAAGMRVAFVPTKADSLTLARELPLPVPGGDVVLARSDLADPGLPALLGRRGAKVRELVAYRTVAEVGSDVGPLRRALDRGSVTVVVASPSAVDALVAAIGRAPLRSATFVAIGERTARAVHDHVGVAALVADATDSQALIRSIAPLEEVMP